MKNKSALLKLLASVFNKGHVTYDKRITNPKRDWFIGISLFIVIVASGAAYSAHMFVAYRNLNTDGGDYDELLVRYNQKLIQEVLSVYQARKIAYDALRNVSVPEIAVPVSEAATSSATTSAAIEELDPQVSSSTETAEEGAVLSI